MTAAQSDAAKSFILHWGELGQRWGINRTVSQIHALLYLSERPLDAAEIAERLQIARSNASTSLRELQGWGLVRVVHTLGDRRDRFETIKDVWQIFATLAAQRRAREVDPALAVLRECAELLAASPGDGYAREQIDAMRELFEVGASMIDEVQRLPTPLLKRFFRLRGKLRALLGKAR
jgi:DNA-binding transcriptional regulator GbsR (MarR family)